ncbi:MAG: ROK family protein [Verrucomicrobia bacterium]|nr:ROK family protein [Verrucomicrobiota bacterium]
MTASSKPYVVGVDLGGTKILAAVFDRRLRLICKSKRSTKAVRGPAAVIERILRAVWDAVDEADLKMEQVGAVGIGAPGATDPESGKIIFAPNLVWRNVPLRDELEKKLKVPVFVENDCNIQALGVHEKELKGKPRNMAGIFIGTGIGAGLILDGKLYAGFNRTAGEIGHMVLDVNGPKCGCGNKGCFEALASRTAIFKTIKKAVKEGRKTFLTEKLGKSLKDMRSGDLRKAIKRGDKLVAKVVERAAFYAGVAAGNIINLLNPEVIVMGGGVIEALGEQMMPVIVSTARKYAMKGTDKGIRILASALGDDAGITGGAVLAWRGLEAVSPGGQEKPAETPRP